MGYLFAIIVILVMSFSFINNVDVLDPTKDQLLGDVTAREMMIFHSASLRYCAITPSNCPAGPISSVNTLSELTSLYTSVPGSIYSNGTFSSFSTGTYVVTYITANNPTYENYYGRILASFKTTLPFGRGYYAGAYSASAQALPAPVVGYTVNAQGDYTSPTQQTLSVPSDDAGSTLPNGVPMIACLIGVY